MYGCSYVAEIVFAAFSKAASTFAASPLLASGAAHGYARIA
jgi:hypothetical protein